MIYIGYHSTLDFNDTYMGSGSKLKPAIINEGIENFEKEVLFIFDNKEDALAAERYVVDEAFVARKNTYNIALGGGTFPKEAQEKINWLWKNDLQWATKRRQKQSNAMKGKMLGENHHMYGKKHSEETKESMRKPKNISEETKKRLRKDRKRRIYIYNIKIKQTKRVNLNELQSYLNQGWIRGRAPFSKETRKRMSESAKGKIISNETRNNMRKGQLGRKHTEETKVKMGRKSKGNKSATGLIWIFCSKFNKTAKIKPSELQSYLSQGWICGRKQ